MFVNFSAHAFIIPVLHKQGWKYRNCNRTVNLCMYINTCSNPLLSDVRLELVLSYSWLISWIRWVSKAVLLSCEFLTAAHDHTHYFKQNWSVAAGRFCNSCQDGFSILPCCDAGTIYLNGRKISTTSKLCLFRGITRYSECLCSSGTQSYSCMKELFWPKLQELGFDPN